MDLDLERYRKKKPSNVSHASRKSNHKHQYHPCKFLINFNWPWRTEPLTELGSYCIICGKIGEKIFLYDTEKAVSFDKENPGAPTFQLADYFVNFVDLTDMRH